MQSISPCLSQCGRPPGGSGSREARRESELSLSEYLEACRDNPLMYASAPERILDAIGHGIGIPNPHDIARIILSRLGCNRYPHVCRSAAGRPGVPSASDLFQSFARSYEARRESELSLSEYLEACRDNRIVRFMNTRPSRWSRAVSTNSGCPIASRMRSGASDLFQSFARSYEARRESELSLSEYLEACRDNPLMTTSPGSSCPASDAIDIPMFVAVRQAARGIRQPLPDVAFSTHPEPRRGLRVDEPDTFSRPRDRPPASAASGGIILSRLGCNRYPHVCRSAAGRPGDPAAAAGAAGLLAMS
jgi:predicted HicB family RNase H-like nuclease